MALPPGYRSLPVLAVEAADVVGEGAWFQVRGVMAARFRVHGPLHQVLVITFGEAADPGKVAGESGDTERGGGRLGLPRGVRVLVIEPDRRTAGVGQPVQRSEERRAGKE